MAIIIDLNNKEEQMSSDNLDEPWDQEDEDEIYEEESPEEDLLSMSDVEMRIEEANCFKALLANPLFSNKNEISKKVENKVRDFVKTELRLLLGLEQPKVVKQTVESQFLPDDIRILKMLIERCRDKEQRALIKPTVNQAAMPRSEFVPQVQPTTVNETFGINAGLMADHKEDQLKPKKQRKKREPKPTQRANTVKRKVVIDGEEREMEMDKGQTQNPNKLPMPSFDQQMMLASDLALTNGKGMGIFQEAGIIPSNLLIDNGE